jgi:pimeloyl-ACP methyl ester carboxylesterase
MPALVVWGDDDRMVPRAHGEAYAAALPEAGALEQVEHCGHAVLLQKPQAVADRVLRFLQSTKS